MTYLITLLPLIGSLFFLPINEDSGNARNHSIIKQIGLSTSLVVLILSIYLLSKSAILFPFFPTWYTNLSEGGIELGTLSLSNINKLEGVDFGNLNTSSISQLESVDSISLYFILLTAFITPICLLSNWNDITFKRKYFVFSFLLLETLQMSFFLVSDLLLFYIYFESVLIPLFIIVGIWGASKARIRASFLLFLYTLAGSLPFLLSILWIAYNFGVTDFQFLNLYELSLETQGWLWYAIMLAFCVKSPTYPFHLWLFRAHAEAPLAGSILLAATILKFATYGFLRVILTLFPDYTANNIYIIQSLAIITLIYSSLVTIRQIDTKSLVAYSSIAHVAVMILGLFSNSLQGIEGGILLSLAHGFVSPALFIIVGGVLYNRYHTRIINYYRGLTIKMPLFSLLFFLFIIFNASAPLSLNFVGEFLALTGIFQDSPIIGALGSTGIVLSAVYSIFLFNRISFLGFSPFIKSEHISLKQNLLLGDLNRYELALLLPLLFVTVIFGIFPNVILESLHYSVTELLYNVNGNISINEIYSL